MKRAALGFSMHSGWGVLVAVSGEPASLDLLDRRRIVTTDPRLPGASQPYHHAATLELPGAEQYLARCAAVSQQLASAAIDAVAGQLHARGFRIAGSAVLLASGRPLPPLAGILASHPLIHTAEGEFFRNTVRQACEHSKIPVTAIRERDLEERAKSEFGNAAARLQRAILALGRLAGPPWTRDHKTAALAAALILAR
jgi:hypothetical protein